MKQQKLLKKHRCRYVFPLSSHSISLSFSANISANIPQAETFYDAEDRDGVRFNWNAFPTTRSEEVGISNLLGCVYSPLNNTDAYPVSLLDLPPIICSNSTCSLVLNPYVSEVVLFPSNPTATANRFWVCPICSQRNILHLPPNSLYADPPEQILPSISSNSTTCEYILKNHKKNTLFTPNIVLFLIDLCIEPDDLIALKNSILSSIDQLPSNAIVGLITFDLIINLYELGFSVTNSNKISFFNKIHIFKIKNDQSSGYLFRL